MNRKGSMVYQQRNKSLSKVEFHGRQKQLEIMYGGDTENPQHNLKVYHQMNSVRPSHNSFCRSIQSTTSQRGLDNSMSWKPKAQKIRLPKGDKPS